jgi:AcrR family transcriptional regulator
MVKTINARTERKKLHDAENRRDILRAAESLILRRGFGRLTMDGLGREAQFSKATLYKYFSSKTEVVVSIFAAFFDRIGDRFNEIAHQDLDASTRLKRIIHSALEVHQDSRNISQALLLDEAFMKKVGLFLAAAGQASSAEDRKLNRLLHSRVQQISKLIGEFLAEGVKAGEFRPMDIPLAASFLGAAINGFGHQKPWLLTKRSIAQETEFIHDLFLHGLARPGEPKKGEQR